jgi:hypothetical protein
MTVAIAAESGKHKNQEIQKNKKLATVQDMTDNGIGGNGFKMGAMVADTVCNLEEQYQLQAKQIQLLRGKLAQTEVELDHQLKETELAKEEVEEKDGQLKAEKEKVGQLKAEKVINEPTNLLLPVNTLPVINEPVITAEPKATKNPAFLEPTKDAEPITAEPKATGEPKSYWQKLQRRIQNLAKRSDKKSDANSANIKHGGIGDYSMNDDSILKESKIDYNPKMDCNCSHANLLCSPLSNLQCLTNCTCFKMEYSSNDTTNSISYGKNNNFNPPPNTHHQYGGGNTPNYNKQ